MSQSVGSERVSIDRFIAEGGKSLYPDMECEQVSGGQR
jgi:hypothetical protein